GAARSLCSPCCGCETSVFHETNPQKSCAPSQDCRASDSLLCGLVTSLSDRAQNLLTGQSCVSGRNGVANEIAHGIGFVGQKPIALGKSLKDRRFANRDGISTPVGMAETPLARCRTSTSDGRRDLVP